MGAVPSLVSLDASGQLGRDRDPPRLPALGAGVPAYAELDPAPGQRVRHHVGQPVRAYQREPAQLGRTHPRADQNADRQFLLRHLAVARLQYLLELADVVDVCLWLGDPGPLQLQDARVELVALGLGDRKSTRLAPVTATSRMPSSACK